ncbi:hypothetical protein HGA91_03170 [candidate division WWE3 bacterium]|nr:hypothetical protein [candidate division WWE3 bacterium]
MSQILSGLGSAQLAQDPGKIVAHQDGGDDNQVRLHRSVRVQFGSQSVVMSYEQAQKLGYVNALGRLVQGRWV